MTSEYKIIRSSGFGFSAAAHTLESSVTEHLSTGWVPLAGPFHSDDDVTGVVRFGQAMTREAKHGQR